MLLKMKIAGPEGRQRTRSFGLQAIQNHLRECGLPAAPEARMEGRGRSRCRGTRNQKSGQQVGTFWILNLLTCNSCIAPCVSDKVGFEVFAFFCDFMILLTYFISDWN